MSRTVALVMAGSRGLGRASAIELANSGHDVAICGRDESTLAATAEELRAAGGSILAVPADVSDSGALAGVVDRTTAELGPIGVLVANAGGPPPGEFADLSDDAWLAGYELTLMSAVRAIRAVLPGMLERKFGRIVVIGSSSVFAPLPNLTLSNVFRPALSGLVASLAREVADAGVTVNLVAPGRIDTDRVRSLDEAKARATGADVAQVRSDSEHGIPVGRYGRPEELGAMVNFLASPQASYVSGQSVLVDGALVPHVG